MGQRLVIAGHHANAAMMARGSSNERAFQRAVTRAQHCELSSELDNPCSFCREDIHPLLPGKARDHAQKRRTIIIELKTIQKRPTVRGTALQRPCQVGCSKMAVRLRIPITRVDAV